MSHLSSVPPSQQTNPGGNKPHLLLLACPGIIQGVHLSPMPRRLPKKPLTPLKLCTGSQSQAMPPRPGIVLSTEVNKQKMGRCTYVHLLGIGSSKRNSVPKYGGKLSWRLAPGKANLQENHFWTVTWRWELRASHQAFVWAPMVSRLGMSCVHSSPVQFFSKIEEH